MTNNSDDFNPLEGQQPSADVQAEALQLPMPEGPQSPLGAVSIPISSAARQKAARMANLCYNPALKETMRRNLLATVALHDYLKLQGYAPDLEASDCWNPILGRTGEVADLAVSQVGRFECCAIEPGAPTCVVAMEGQFGRSGYVAVELDEQERWGWLLGFVPGGNEIDPVETLERAALASMDEFGCLLQRLSSLWTIVQSGSEPWAVELRETMVALLERVYREHDSAERPLRAVNEIEQLYNEQWGESVTAAESRVFVGASSREGDTPAQLELRKFLREVFDQLEDVLPIEEEIVDG
jgi:hypothetical protein